MKREIIPALQRVSLQDLRDRVDTSSLKKKKIVSTGSKLDRSTARQFLTEYAEFSLVIPNHAIYAVASRYGDNTILVRTTTPIENGWFDVYYGRWDAQINYWLPGMKEDEVTKSKIAFDSIYHSDGAHMEIVAAIEELSDKLLTSNEKAAKVDV